MSAAVSIVGIVVGGLLFALAVWQGVHWLTGAGILLLAVATIVGLQGSRPIIAGPSASDPSGDEVESESSGEPDQNLGGSANTAAQ